MTAEVVASEEECIRQLDLYNGTTNELFCPRTWMMNQLLCVGVCWPTTPVNTTAVIPCPPSKWWPTTRTLQLYCQPNGLWENVTIEKVLTKCIDELTLDLMEKEFGQVTSQEQVELYENVTYSTKILQIVGYSISLASLIIALLIFYSFRSLHCPRTQIHKLLFIAYTVWLVLDVILSVDLTQDKKTFDGGCGHGIGERSQKTIRNTPILCETFEVFREYTRFCVFSWNFVEGLYLHRMVTAAVFRKPNFKLYYAIGWVLPIFPVLGWAIAMPYTSNQKCWLGYNYSPYYWIIEAPRNALLFVNLIFLINIVRVIVTKMRETNTTDTMQIKKAAKAAIVLVPLLGVINLLFLPEKPDSTDPAWIVYLYFYSTSVLITFQGFVCALIFCFFNGEVQQAIKRKWTAWRDSRNPQSRRGTATTHTCISELNGRNHIPSRSSWKDKLQYIRMNSICDVSSDNSQNKSNDITAV
ncbi:PDF receptor-like [Ptychodera flava]|uniref:PDF receptor-like n=1 Tax=Ptychodera flava TaxID=63121 RepID=UPI00396A717F